MNYRDLISQISTETDYSIEDVRCILEKMCNIIKCKAQIGDEVRLSDIGKFVSVVKQPSEIKNVISRISHKECSGNTVSSGRVSIKFRQYEKSKSDLWNSTVFSKIFKE